MELGIKLKVWGEYACFTRPECKMERLSYDVLTPSAAVGLLSAIYWKPEMVWVIDKIKVLNPIKFECIMKNEVGTKISPRNVETAMKTGEPIFMYADKERQQRTTTLLRDVAYIIYAHPEAQDPQKHFDIFTRRAQLGQCFHQPYFGIREYTAHFELLEGPAEETSVYCGVMKEFGLILHHIAYDLGEIPATFRAVMIDGTIQVSGERVYV
jgi:CRISPR-associated protein Cas5d